MLYLEWEIRKSCIKIKISQFLTTTPKGRRIPINLQDKVISELKKLLSEKHKTKLTNFPDKHYLPTHSHRLTRPIYKNNN